MTDSAQFPATRFVAFGQFVQNDALAVMAYTIFHRRDIARARRTLTRARLALGAPATVRFDGTALFGGAAPPEPVARNRLHGMLDAFNAVPGMVRYTYIHTQDNPAALDDSEVGRKARASIRGVLQQACFSVPAGGDLGPQAHECEALSVDEQNRASHAHGVLLDLADMVAHACSHALQAGPSSWVAAELGLIRYWSNQEVTARLEAAADA